jgi:NADPH:quinone reductase-like Zn-dependent oxidoreductase
VGTTCSPRDFDHVKKAGAAYAFDFNDAEVVTRIRDAFSRLAHAFNTLGSVNSSAIAAANLNVNTEVLCTVRPGKANTEGIPTTITVTGVFVFIGL